ncbi:GW dipeptide domain-containing protein [Staphylococcus lutrae]|uniref:Bifunctional autolysin n=1 Tax=Staphylococcus lutrae TaxID=155085 RepID=A0AAC9RTH6_9STAP|nr:GW dipeptide domain-containing protein [Staphylococcus lutrae]ARJ51484.1 autolysin [Staphylococcus lutrae]PNZ38673.1 autolysin [Staphylococcus lutrae]
MVKKFGYKTPAMLALTLAGTAYTAHHADAAEQSPSDKPPINDRGNTNTLNQAQTVSKVTTSASTLAGSQTYKDPKQIDPIKVTTVSQTDKSLTDIQQTGEQGITGATSQDKTQTDALNQTSNTPQRPHQETPNTNMNHPVASEKFNTQQRTDNSPTTNNNPANQTIPKQNEVAATTQGQSIKAVVNSTPKDINANPDGPTPPRVGGKGGPATLSLTPSNQTAYRAATVSTPSPYQPQVKSSINDYIRKKGYQVPKYEEDYSVTFPKYGYRNGVGAPEGIVLHDTANDNSTINSEIAYMKRNYQNAFVHGFIDGNRIIETHPTDYLAWGAGAIANQRYIHIELVHVHDYDSFARQMNNMADYAATNLQYYNLKPDSAEYDGRGTVWTHAAVSKFLGGTDHVDPHGYLKQHGYSYDELYDLINEKYQVKMGYALPAGSTSPPAPSKPSTNTNLTVNAKTGYGRIATKNSGLYQTVYDTAGKSTNQINKTLKVTKEAALNGNKFYLVSDGTSNQLLGWVKQEDVTYQNAQAEKSKTQNYQIKPGTVVYQVPWGTNSQVTGTVAGSNNATFKGTKEQTVGNTQWLYGTVNQITGWINANSIAPDTPKPSTNTGLQLTNDTGLGRINSKNSGLYATVYDKNGKATSATNQTFKVTKKANLNGETFYLVSDYLNGSAIGWVKKSDVNYQTSQAPTTINETYTVPSGATLYLVPWGTNNQVAGQVSGTGQQTFKATQSQKVGALTYVYGTANQLSGWIDSSLLTASKATNNLPQSVSQMGQLKVTNSGIKASIYDAKAKDASTWAGQTYKVTKYATARNEDYVLLLNQNATTPLGWFKAADVLTRDLSAEKIVNGQYTVNNNTTGLYSVPWGTVKQRIDNLKTSVNATFSAQKSVTVGNDTFLFGSVNQKLGWINQKELTAVAPKIATRAAAPQVGVKGVSTTVPSHIDDYFVTNAKGYYYAKAGDKKAAGTLNAFYEQLFKVQKSTLSDGITWYYGKFENGVSGWVKAADLRSTLIKYYKSPSTLKAALDKQMALSYPPQTQRVPGKWVDATRDETLKAMDTNALAKDSTQIYQFLKLDQYQGLKASDLNKLLVGKGILEGQGQAFQQAAQTHNINEIYLISHALLETGNGTSQLANGGYVDSKNKVVTTDSKKYYNMFGIGAVDTDALRSGFKTAEQYGWNTVSKAIVGGAKFIRDKYLDVSQNTLYRMRWNPQNPAVHQYATDIQWASVNASRMKHFYNQIGESGIYFDIDTYQ